MENKTYEDKIFEFLPINEDYIKFFNTIEVKKLLDDNYLPFEYNDEEYKSIANKIVNLYEKTKNDN